MDANNDPGVSKTRVNKAGNAIRDGNAKADDLLIIEEWRAAHRAVLNTFQATLRTRVRGNRSRGWLGSCHVKVRVD